MKNLELYIHIPFCKKKCSYCDFLSFASTKEEQKSYVEAVINEIEQYVKLAEQYIVSTIFIGGGTPSILEGEEIVRIMEKVREVFRIDPDAEISIEVNPGTMSLHKIKAYKAVGINRVSIGLQATNDEELRILGRIHNYQEFLDTYNLLQQNGLDNINVDLINAIPNQTVSSWEKTLDKIIKLNPTHISAYSLIIEEDTLFYEKYGEYEALLPSEEDERSMYYLTKEKLEEAGYVRYEISNYSKMNYECKHNLGYWDRIDYVGIGLGSASLIDEKRYSNERNIKEYIEKIKGNKSIRVEEEILTKKEQMEEFMFLGLRKIRGIQRRKFEEIFCEKVEKVYQKQLERLVEQGLIELKEECIYLTEKGIDVSNIVLAEFLL